VETNEIKKIVLDTFKDEFSTLGELTSETQLHSVNFNSIQRVALILLLEKKFNTNLSSLMLHDCKSVSEIANRIYAHLR